MLLLPWLLLQVFLDLKEIQVVAAVGKAGLKSTVGEVLHLQLLTGVVSVAKTGLQLLWLVGRLAVLTGRQGDRRLPLLR